MSELLDAILEYESSIRDDYNILRGNMLPKEVKEMLAEDSNAFLVGLISDQSVKAELAWSLPYRLRERLGYFEVERLCEELSVDELASVIREKPALHRYPANMAKYIYAACERLTEEYDGNASNIWGNGVPAAEVSRRLEEFKGISHKKAALGCLLLVRDLDLDVPDKENIDIAYDIHIRRICLRMGVAKEDTVEAVSAAGRAINPPFPGRMTSSFWAIGRDICRPSEPRCDVCPLARFCERKIELGRDLNA